MIMKKLDSKQVATRKKLLGELQDKLHGWHKDSVGKQFKSAMDSDKPQMLAEGGTIQDRSNAEEDAKLHNDAVAEDNAGDADKLVDMPKDGLVDEGDEDVEAEADEIPREKSAGVKLEDLIARLSKGK